jgi:protein-disulfide isomerase
MSILQPPVTDDDHFLGSGQAMAELVEYGDYECPFCGRAHGVVRTLYEQLGSQLRFAFRHFPITSAHPHALLAAEAAEAAGVQGRFWEMHDMLYTHQRELQIPDLLDYAAQVGLDLDRFTDELRLHRYRERVRADQRSGMLSGVQGTPTFFINGRRHDGGYDFESLYSAIAAASGAELSL